MNSASLPPAARDKIAFQQVLLEDQSVFSVQTVFIPGDGAALLTSAQLLQLYLAYIRRFTLGLISTVESPSGLEFRLTGTSLAIITFSPTVTETNGSLQTSTVRISGGLLVQRQECDRGQLDFMVEAADTGSRVTLKLSDYCPLLLGSREPSLWRKWLYRLTQAYIHIIVTTRFLATVYRRICGEKVKKGLVRIAVRSGVNT